MCKFITNYKKRGFVEMKCVYLTGLLVVYVCLLLKMSGGLSRRESVYSNHRLLSSCEKQFSKESVSSV